MTRMPARSLAEVDGEIAELAAQKFVLLDYLTRDLQHEIDECDQQIDGLLDERSQITEGESDG